MSFEVAVERAGLGYELVCRGRRRVLGALPEVGARYDAACDTGVEETRDRLLVEIGRELFAWLDGVDGWLRGWVAEDDPAPVLRLDLHAAGAGFGKAPWELLHDGVSFLASRGMVVARVVSSRKSPLVRANRYLEILFVAMAPEDGGPSLSYEAEEVAILQAAATQPVGLLVEETGSLSGVRDAVLSLPDARRLDVLHFTGHGAMEDGTPYLVAESEFGEADWVSADRLGKALEGVWPRIVFLSTCHSAERGTAPALGEEMVRLGAELSVGFAHPVYDRTGITAATAFYGELAAGRGPEQAARRAMGRMLEEGCPDWHLLRVFAEAGYGGPLVTTLRTPGRVAYRRPAAEMEYLDADQRMRIAGSAFVGRRQAMQRCWRVMQVASELRAIYLWGMGGLGKSSLAGRLVRRAQERNPKLRQVVVFGAFGEAGLRSRLADRYADRPRVLAALNDGLALAGQLRNFFQVVEEAGEPAVIVLDDFEQNMPGHRDGDLRVEPGAYRLLLDLLEAVRVDGNWSRVIVTCRYGMANLGWHEEALERMPEAEARKVVAGVERAEEVDQASAEGKARQLGREAAVLSAADGNPRLLAWLGRLPEDETFTELVSAKREEFREDIFAQQLLASLTEEELEAVARICWFNEPVEVAVVVGMGASEERLGRAVELGLVEFTKDGMYRVPEVLRGLLEELFVGEVKGWKEMAARVAFEFWTNEPFRMGRAEELFRLGLNAGVREVGIVAGTLIGNELTHQLRFQEVLRLHERFNFVFGVHYRFDLLAGRAGTFLGHPDALEWLDRAAKNIPTDRQDDKQEVLSHTVVLLRLLGKDELARQMACGIYEGGISSQMVQLLGADRLQLRGSTAEARRTYDAVLRKNPSPKFRAMALRRLGEIAAEGKDFDEAKRLYKESLEISKRADYSRGMVAALSSMAQIEESRNEAVAMLKESAHLLAESCLWPDLVTILYNLGCKAGVGVPYWAQALWLAGKVKVAPMRVALVCGYLGVALGPKHILTRGVAGIAIRAARNVPETDPHFEEVMRPSMGHWFKIAVCEGVRQEEFEAWLGAEMQKPLDRAAFEAGLEQLIGDTWLFDRTKVGATKGQGA